MSLRRLVAFVVVAAGLCALVLGARPDAPVEVSLSLLRKFWGANDRTRRMNSPVLRNEQAFGRALIDGDETWSLRQDVRLCLPSNVSPTDAEQLRRKAAFVLAPRFVRLDRGCSATDPFRLEPFPESGGSR